MDVLAVVGPITSQAISTPSSPVLASRKTPLLYATNYEGGKCSRYMFAFNTVPNQEPRPLLVPYMTKTRSAPTISCSAPIATGRIACLDAAEPLIAKLGGKVVAKQYTSWAPRRISRP